MSELKTNVLYYGDNLEILRHHIPDESVDLVYLDPPFNSKADYNVLFREESGERSAAQIKAFSDFWHWDRAAEETYREIVETCPDEVATMVSAMRQAIRDTDVMAYLVMMTLRLVELRRVLKPTGSLYLHCDPTASHYLKIVMDTIFGPRNFRNEIVWQRTRVAKRQSGFFGKTHDIVFLYTKGEQTVFKSQFAEHPESYKESHYNLVEGESDRRYGLWDFTQKGAGPPRRFGEVELAPPPGKHWIWSQERIDQALEGGRIVFTKSGTPRLKRYLDESMGEYLQDIWTDVFDINAVARERLGYPTQKPLALLERIIQASSNEGDVVLDPFCGCGTAVVAAHKLNRRWIGIDITFLAVDVMRKRLCDSFKPDFPTPKDVTVIGEPVDVGGARALAAQDRYQFQWWALSLVSALPAGDDRKKGADTGIDGVIGFVEEKGKAARVIVSVKSGGVNVGQVRDLKGVVEREKATMGLFITLEPSTEPMRVEAVSAGFYHSALWDKDYPKIQILTVEELLAGRQASLPPSASGGFAKAPRLSRQEGEQGGLI
jgi:site-specific DNA-methyltransferase (adenine-specific)